ncbi:MAG: dTMP kinase [Armatimonadota bacterium]|nr:dTMP kinase [Armatimonadota bacterium]
MAPSPDRPRRGLFVTIEGPEGAGKSTHARRLHETFRDVIPLILTREPGGTALGEAIRTLLLDERYRGMSPEAEMLLFAASRAQFVTQVVVPNLEAGRCVLSERFVDASLAYQGYGRGLPIEVVRRVNDVAVKGLRPDLTLLIDIDPAAGLSRARNAHGKDAPAGRGDRLEQEDLAFHARVRAGFLELAREEPARFVVVNGTLPRDEVHAALVAAVRRLLRDHGWPTGE